MPFYRCSWCNKDTFRSKGGLTNHQKNSCKYKPTSQTTTTTTTPDPVPPVSEPVADVGHPHSDDDELSVGVYRLGTGGEAAASLDSRYANLLHRFDSATDEESVQEATIFPLESDSEDDSEEESVSSGTKEGGEEPDPKQEVQELLQRAEVASPTRGARSRSCKITSQQAPRPEDLGLDEEVDMGEASLANNGGALMEEAGDQAEIEADERENNPTSNARAEVNDDAPEDEDLSLAAGDFGQHEDNNESQEVEDDDQEDKDDAHDGGNGDDMSNKQGPITSMRDQFREYCDYMKDHTPPMSREMKACIKLLDVMKRKKTSLDTFNDILLWHLRETSQIMPHETIADATGYCLRETWIKQLRTRYNMEDKFPFYKSVLLPANNTVVKLVCHHFLPMVQSLLSDPRVKDKDYLFGNDPFAPPEENPLLVKDLNTAAAYRKAYQRFIKRPGEQILLGILPYMDGAVTGNFENLSVTAFKIALGIHKRTTRDKDWAWRIVGFLAEIMKEQARGKKMFVDSAHMDTDVIALLPGEGELAPNVNRKDEINKDQVKMHCFHTMILTILEEYLEAQGRNLIWDLAYRGTVYKNVEFVLFVPFVKGDTKEADENCGKFGTRTGNVEMLCRYCCCPTRDSDNPLAKNKEKTQKMIETLINCGKTEALRQLSQHCVPNAWHKVRFGDPMGVHVSCPSEMLHAILLGIFKYLRDIFFEQIGPASLLASEINALSRQYGLLFSHQSDRDLPRTHFPNGINKGKKQAKEFRGILLLMLAILRSDKGQRLLRGKPRFRSNNNAIIKDWIMLVELLLMWETYLCEDELQVKHVVRMRKKMRFLMHLIKMVARRQKGMGLKLMKFHAILHLADDILNFGVPKEYDTGSNESHHKPTKSAAKLTQKKAETFIFQTCTRLDEYLLIDLAMEELNGNKIWDYYARHSRCSGEDSESDLDMDCFNKAKDLAPQDCENASNDDDTASNEQVSASTGGTTIVVWKDPDVQNPLESLCFAFPYTKKGKESGDEEMSVVLLAFLFHLQLTMEDVLDGKNLPIYTEHKRNGQIFRAHPNYRGGGPWRDWVIINWGPGHGYLPGHISCFVEVDGIPTDGLRFEGMVLEDGVYAVVENAFYVQDEEQNDMSDLFKPIQKEVQRDNNGEFIRLENTDIIARKFFLADVNALVEPCCVVPNIGGPENEYFIVKQRPEWVDCFVEWLESKHEIFQEDEEKLQQEMGEIEQEKARKKKEEEEAIKAVKKKRKEVEKAAKKAETERKRKERQQDKRARP